MQGAYKSLTDMKLSTLETVAMYSLFIKNLIKITTDIFNYVAVSPETQVQTLSLYILALCFLNIYFWWG